MLANILEQVSNGLDVVMENIGSIIVLLITGGSILGLIARFTPSTKDDKFASDMTKVGNELGSVQLELNVIKQRVDEQKENLKKQRLKAQTGVIQA